MTRHEEVQAKLAKVRTYLDESGLSAIVLGTRANFSWLTGGGHAHVGLAAAPGVAWLVVTADDQLLITDNIEEPRFAAEEVGDLPFEIRSQQWNEEDRAAIVGTVASGSIGADLPLPFAEDVSPSFNRLRWQLMEPEIERYREVAAAASRAIAATGQDVEVGMSEHEIAALLMGRTFAAGAQPAVALVAADERAYRFRHPIPTDRELEAHVMLVIGASKYGLGVFATRMVHFGEPPVELREKHAACCYVDAAFNLETRPGVSVAEIFRNGTVAYEESGFAEEWRLHHQGGATGYAPREYKGTLNSEETVLEGQAFAWNPSIAGTKSEDTIIATADGPRFLSEPAGWPTLEVNYNGITLQRPDILVR